MLEQPWFSGKGVDLVRSAPRFYRILSALVMAMFVMYGCGDDGGGEQAAGGPGGKGGGPDGGKPSQPPIPVAIDEAELGVISSYYTATATLAPEKQAEILSRVNGVVSSLSVEEGDGVASNGLLLSIAAEEYQFRLAQASANRADIESKLARLESMRSQDLVSAEEFESIKNNLKAAQAEEGLARVNLSYTRVKAPFAGHVVTRHVDIGQNVSVGTPLFSFSDFNPLLARIFVPAKEFNKLQADQPVDLTLESSGTRLKGIIKLISPTIDPSSGTIKVTVEISEYPADTRPGDFAQVSIVTERRERRTLVPRIAVVTDRGEQVVYVSADSTAERRVVEIGFEDDLNAEIISGIEIGEQVVVKGQRTLKHGSLIKILEDTFAEAKTDSSKGS
jgi:membrane fusion protein (multidrug efflux system)